MMVKEGILNAIVGCMLLIVMAMQAFKGETDFVIMNGFLAIANLMFVKTNR